jgi:hypothetical protein
VKRADYFEATRRWLSTDTTPFTLFASVHQAL